MRNRKVWRKKNKQRKCQLLFCCFLNWASTLALQKKRNSYAGILKKSSQGRRLRKRWFCFWKTSCLEEKMVTFVVLMEVLLCLGCGPSHWEVSFQVPQEDEDVRWISVGRNFHRCCHQQRICLKATSQLLKTKCVKSLLAIERTRDRQLLEKLKLISECGPNSYSVKRN